MQVEVMAPTTEANDWTYRAVCGRCEWRSGLVRFSRDQAAKDGRRLHKRCRK